MDTQSPQTNFSMPSMPGENKPPQSHIGIIVLGVIVVALIAAFFLFPNFLNSLSSMFGGQKPTTTNNEQMKLPPGVIETIGSSAIAQFPKGLPIEAGVAMSNTFVSQNASTVSVSLSYISSKTISQLSSDYTAYLTGASFKVQVATSTPTLKVISASNAKQETITITISKNVVNDTMKVSLVHTTPALAPVSTTPGFPANFPKENGVAVQESQRTLDSSHTTQYIRTYVSNLTMEDNQRIFLSYFAAQKWIVEPKTPLVNGSVLIIAHNQTQSLFITLKSGTKISVTEMVSQPIPASTQ